MMSKYVIHQSLHIEIYDQKTYQLDKTKISIVNLFSNKYEWNINWQSSISPILIL